MPIAAQQFDEVLDPEREDEELPEQEPITAPEPDTLPEEPDLDPPEERAELSD